jgi:BA14K-like protein
VELATGSVQPAKPVQPAKTAHKPRERTMAMLCTHFRTYNPSSKTYRGYDGQTHSCR